MGRLLTVCALISLPGASWSGGAYQGSAPVRWAFRSPWVRRGGEQEPLLQGLEAASPTPGPHAPSPPCGRPSLPHQDTEHCMNSGLNGIISEFWSTASSGYFTNSLSLPCGGQSPGRGRITDAGRPPSPARGGASRCPPCRPAQRHPQLCKQTPTPHHVCRGLAGGCGGGMVPGRQREARRWEWEGRMGGKRRGRSRAPWVRGPLLALPPTSRGPLARTS